VLFSVYTRSLEISISSITKIRFRNTIYTTWLHQSVILIQRSTPFTLVNRVHAWTMSPRTLLLHWLRFYTCKAATSSVPLEPPMGASPSRRRQQLESVEEVKFIIPQPLYGIPSRVFPISKKCVSATRGHKTYWRDRVREFKAWTLLRRVSS
jgi:hypothetical protein